MIDVSRIRSFLTPWASRPPKEDHSMGRWVTFPRIFPITQMGVDYTGLRAFLESEGIEGFRSDAETPADEIPEIAGRLCYMSYESPRPGGNAAYIENILDQGHGSVLEHANLGFIFTGVSRSLTHEFIRHRVGFAYSELSQRYVDASNVRFVVPPRYLGREHGHERMEFERCCMRCLGAYTELVWRSTPDDPSKANRKRMREAARSVLPNATETKLYATGNLRSWRHFVTLRSGAGADLEIRRLANVVYYYLLGEAPNTFKDFEEVPQHGGFDSLVPCNVKV